jgi:hypothetical protein
MNTRCRTPAALAVSRRRCVPSKSVFRDCQSRVVAEPAWITTSMPLTAFSKPAPLARSPITRSSPSGFRLNTRVRCPRWRRISTTSRPSAPGPPVTSTFISDPLSRRSDFQWTSSLREPEVTVPGAFAHGQSPANQRVCLAAARNRNDFDCAPLSDAARDRGVASRCQWPLERRDRRTPASSPRRRWRRMSATSSANSDCAIAPKRRCCLRIGTRRTAQELVAGSRAFAGSFRSYEAKAHDQETSVALYTVCGVAQGTGEPKHAEHPGDAGPQIGHV